MILLLCSSIIVLIEFSYVVSDKGVFLLRLLIATDYF